jgi:propionyl-CoA carboxylase alpha chain
VRDGENFQVSHDGQAAETVTLGGWRPGRGIVEAMVAGVRFIIRIERRPSGFRLRYRGSDLRAFVRTPREAELARLMPEKVAPDTSKMLICPMPGLVVAIQVSEGDEVQDGQPLATIEAMKMENILRAERKAKVAKINAKAGDSLAVDAVIMEFE